MTRIDFYIVSSTGVHAAIAFSCRLAEKAWRSGHRVLLHCDNSQQASELDEQLWQFKPESFLPHSRDLESNTAVAICHGGKNAPMGDHCDLLINLANELPEQFSRFKRLAEVVDQRRESLEASRQRYSFYKRRGYPLHSHNVNQTEG